MFKFVRKYFLLMLLMPCLQLKAAIKNWEDKHLELSEQIKVYHRSQKDLEDSLVLKDHNVEVGQFLNDSVSFFPTCVLTTRLAFLAGAV